MKRVVLLFTLSILASKISADIFDVYWNVKAYQGLDYDTQNTIAQKIVSDIHFTLLKDVKLFGHTDTVLSLAWSPDTSTLASGGRNHVIHIWDTDSGIILKTLWGHADGVSALAWSPDGKLLASGSYNGTIKICDTATWKQKKTIIAHPQSITALVWRPNGTQLASAGRDKKIQIWDAQSWQNTQTLQGHLSSVESLAWNPTGTLLASGSWNKNIKIWDVSTGQIIQSLDEHTGAVKELAWSTSGALLTSTSAFETITWDATTWQSINRAYHLKKMILRAWNANHTRLALAHDSVIRILFYGDLLTTDDLYRLTLEQALFLKLLHTLRPTFGHAQKKQLPLKSIHARLKADEAQKILESFSTDAQSRIKNRYGIFVVQEPELSAHEHRIFWGF